MLIPTSQMFRYRVLLLIAFFFGILTNSCRGSQSRKKIKKYLRIVRFEGTCPGLENVDMEYENITLINREAESTIINYDGSIKRDIRGNLQLMAIVERCQSRETLDTCSHFYTFKTKQFCKLVRSKMDAWTPFLDCTTPRWECPFKQGIYRGRNCTFDSSKFNLFNLDQGYWKVRSEVVDLDDNTTKLCCIFEGSSQ